MEINKKEVGIGAVSLIISAVLQSFVLCKYQNDWMMLICLILYAIVFLKYWYESGIEHWINNKFKKKNVKIVGFIMLFIGISFLPQSFGKMMSEILEFFSYIVSFICWMLGLFLIEVASEKA